MPNYKIKAAEKLFRPANPCGQTVSLGTVCRLILVTFSWSQTVPEDTIGPFESFKDSRNLLSSAQCMVHGKPFIYEARV